MRDTQRELWKIAFWGFQGSALSWRARRLRSDDERTRERRKSSVPRASRRKRRFAVTHKATTRLRRTSDRFTAHDSVRRHTTKPANACSRRRPARSWAAAAEAARWADKNAEARQVAHGRRLR
jgi:hypothetical protein